jgi:hypothetical protein
MDNEIRTYTTIDLLKKIRADLGDYIFSNKENAIKNSATVRDLAASLYDLERSLAVGHGGQR